MLDRIRDKLNKFSEMTYDSIKAWLSELLDSDETGFLTDFITLVFEKAAVEKPFCALYARLITELRAGFPHLDVELRRIYKNFMSIFEEAAEEPAVGSAHYDEFVAQRERRKFRRGYAGFIGEIAALGVVANEDLIRTCEVILVGLGAAKASEEKKLLCEEYADCLSTLVKAGDKTVLAPLKPAIRTAMDRAGAPGLTNKARFSLMDLVDLLP